MPRENARLVSIVQELLRSPAQKMARQEICVPKVIIALKESLLGWLAQSVRTLVSLEPLLRQTACLAEQDITVEHQA